MGSVAAICYGINRVLTRFRIPACIYIYELLAQPVADKPIVPSRLGRSFVVRQINAGDPVLTKIPVPPQVIHERFGQSAVCLGMFKNDELAAYLWLCLGPYNEDEVRCTFEPQPGGESAWDFDVYVFPEHRMGIAFARLWDVANEYLRDRQIAYTFSRVSAFNTISAKSHRRLDARKIGRAVFLVTGFVQLMLCSRHPYVHLSLRSASKPTIRVTT